MFTTEMDHDETKITLLDDQGFHEDVIFYLYDDCVVIRQWCDLTENYSEIIMSVEMFDEFIASMNKPEGAYTYRMGKIIGE